MKCLGTVEFNAAGKGALVAAIGGLNLSIYALVLLLPTGPFWTLYLLSFANPHTTSCFHHINAYKWNLDIKSLSHRIYSIGTNLLTCHCQYTALLSAGVPLSRHVFRAAEATFITAWDLFEVLSFT